MVKEAETIVNARLSWINKKTEQLLCQLVQTISRDLKSQSNEKGQHDLSVRKWHHFIFQNSRNLVLFRFCSLNDRTPFLLSILLTVNLTTEHELPQSQTLLLSHFECSRKFFNVSNIRLAITWHDLLIFYKWLFFFCDASSNREIPFYERTAMTTSLLSHKKATSTKKLLCFPKNHLQSG